MSRSGARRRTPPSSRGEPMIWLTGGCLALSAAMIAGLVLLVLVKGGGTFWPGPLLRVERGEGAPLLGEITENQTYRLEAQLLATLPEATRARAASAIERDGPVIRRRMLRTGNFDLSGSHFHWVSDFEVTDESRPEWAILVERISWGRFYGFPAAFLVDGEPVAKEPEGIWRRYREHHGASVERRRKRVQLEKHESGRVRREQEEARLAVRRAVLRDGAGSAAARDAERALLRTTARCEAEGERIERHVRALDAENARFVLVLQTAAGEEKRLLLADIVRAYPANRLGFFGRLGVYFARWWEFLSEDPRESNSEGGVLPAIFGTVVMTLIMSLLVVPFGVLAALYLREYAKPGPIVSVVRIAVNNLAGVPSIVFGVFGLGFFCYIVGSSVDALLFSERLPDPTFGTGGLLWASLTLALMTLPVVIVATEEALAAVPRSMREGSYACGASRWQTIRRIVLPRAMPGILTGMILAIARGAGEVAPLMLVGASKVAPELPVDGVFPFLHPERKFMHLGFHIYDLGFQSQNSEAAKPMVYTTTLLLILLVITLNVTAMILRARLRRRFTSGVL
ncbi:MAG: phosphate ABC transporter permease PstA [Planctomycetaceae bacterium]